MDLVGRVKAVMLTPRSEWLVIEGEPADAMRLLAGYVAPLALIPALCGFIGASIVGNRLPVTNGLLEAIIDYLLAFVAVGVLAMLLNLLAPTFGGRKSFADAIKLSVYAQTPYWLAGVFLLVPGLSFLRIFALYGFYLLWLGVTPLMRAPEEKSLPYAAIVVGAAVASAIIFAALQDSVAGAPQPA